MRGFLLLLVGVMPLLKACGPNQAPDQQEQAEPVRPIQAESKLDPQYLARFPDATHQQFSSYFSEMAERGRFSGVVLMQADHQFFIEAFGHRHLRDRDTLALEDRFQLASLSKPVTAFGVLTLVEQGKVALDAFVSDYLFDFPFPEVTVRSLLDHTSGLGNYIYITDSLWNNPDSFMTNRNVYEYIRCEQLPIYYPPHRRFDYCNTNYALLPILIEEVSGLPFTTYMEEEIFKPLGMFQTAYLNPLEMPSDEYPVLGHYPNGDPKRPFYLNGVIGDKSLYSNVFDLYKFYRELQEPTLISKSLINEAMCPQVNTSYDRYYGLGWRIQPLEGDTLVFHNGWWRGFRSYFWMSKQQDKLAIILTNSIRGGYLKQEEIWSMF
jgi:CubicO group peptidase (beta-lactamase class C family)